MRKLSTILLRKENLEAAKPRSRSMAGAWHDRKGTLADEEGGHPTRAFHLSQVGRCDIVVPRDRPTNTTSSMQRHSRQHKLRNINVSLHVWCCHTDTFNMQFKLD